MELQPFLDYVYAGNETGYFNVSFFKGNVPIHQRFLEWPKQRHVLTDDALLAAAQEFDVYYTPALFKVPERTASAALGSWVAWVDLDSEPGTVLPGDTPSWPAAGLVVASGSPGRSHRYWRSESFLTPRQLEARNKQLSVSLGADPSGIDVSQLLRLPNTYNHKHSPPRRVETISRTENVVTFSDFVLPEIPLAAQVERRTVSLDRWNDLDSYTRQIFNTRPALGTRSDKLFELACRLLEQEWSPEEAKGVVDEAAKTWRKFDGRSDRSTQLDTIIQRAKERTKPALHIVEELPIVDSEPEIDWTQPVSIGTLLREAPTIEWIIPGILRKGGLLYLVGPTGVGKSTVSMNFCLMLALGKAEWLSLKLNCENEKILFGSHEMDSAELREFFQPMVEHMGLDDDEYKRLDANLYINTKGTATALDDLKFQRIYEEQLGYHNYTGLVIDTLGASTRDSLQDEKGARTIADWIDKIRQKYGIWVVVISHPRKAPSGVKNHVFGIDDAYGSRIFGDRANTVLMMQRTKQGLELHSVKTRFMSGMDRLYLKRNNKHWYELGTPVTQAPVQVVNEPNLQELVSKMEMMGDDFDVDK